MKHVLTLIFLVISSLASANDAKNNWHATSLTEATIKKIQQSQYQYKKCVMTEMQKKGYFDVDTRHATEAIIKQCEPVLTKMRQVYLDEKVPDVIADRHLKKMRIDITRRVLKQMMFVEAAKKAGNQ